MDYQFNQPNILDGGVVTYRTEQDVYTFPVAPGYRVTFVNSGSDVVFRKTFFPQTPQPMIERLIMVPDKQQQTQQDPMTAILARLEALEKKVTEANQNE